MTVEIHHVKPGPEHENRRFIEHGLSWDERQGWYEHVATLKVPSNVHSADDALNFAYDETQHDRKPWIEGPSVRWAKEEARARTRSSAIGDVFVVCHLGETTRTGMPYQTGTPYQVDFEGFSDIRTSIRRDRKAGADAEVPFYGVPGGEWPGDAASNLND